MSATAQPRARRLDAERAVFDAEVTCPAGIRISEANGGTSCRCTIVHDTVDYRDNPSALTRFCMGNYMACPTWRDKRDAELQGQGDAHQDEMDRDAQMQGAL